MSPERSKSGTLIADILPRCYSAISIYETCFVPENHLISLSPASHVPVHDSISKETQHVFQRSYQRAEGPWRHRKRQRFRVVHVVSSCQPEHVRAHQARLKIIARQQTAQDSSPPWGAPEIPQKGDTTETIMPTANNEKAVVVYVETQRPTHIRSMFGRLIVTSQGILFYPFGIAGDFIEAPRCIQRHQEPL